MKRKLLVVLTIIIFSGKTFAQEPENISAHQEQMAKYSSKEKVASKFAVSGKDIIPLQKSQVKDLSKIVFGFLPDWEYTSGAHTNMHYDLLTHLAVFNFLADSNGNLSNPSGWPWTDVINTAHSNSTKVIMAVTNFGGTEAAADVAHKLMTNTTSKNNLFNNIKTIITTYQLDGVNIDFEGLTTDDRGSILNTFMSDLTNFIHTNLPGKEVSFDGPAVNWGGWNLDGLAQSVDHIFIMAYDYHGGWSDNTGAVAPLTHPSGGICLTKTLSNDYSVPKSKYPEKLIMGVPYYGKHWKTSTGDAGSSITNYVGSTFYKTAVTDAATHGGFIWDNASQTPWYKWNSGGWNQVWQDNEPSLSKKYDLALTENLGGIGIWALNYDGNRNELWDLINTKFNNLLTIDDSFIKTNLTLYPNPTNGLLKIDNPNFLEINEVAIFNIYGQKLQTKFQNNTVDISRYSNGIYLIRIEDKNGKQGTFKIIKN
ncbi:MAG: glycosyl hydrolase family 18 protein [Bacteroidota bacterium]